jgi:hypothetical protein
VRMARFVSGDVIDDATCIGCHAAAPPFVDKQCITF